MKRLLALAAVALVVASGCNTLDQDSRELRSTLIRSELEPRSFEYKAVSDSASYVVRGSIEDDFRSKMSLWRGGRQLMQYVVSDDLLAIRLVDPRIADGIRGQLGHPTVEGALRAGQWVVDPSGAPPLIEQQTGPSQESSGDPFRDARESLRYVDRSIAQAVFVGKYTDENIEYRPQFDPWRYPRESEGEIRYDLTPPQIPRNEGQGRAEADVGPAHFRKLSVFVDGSRIREVCNTVDVEGSRAYVELAEKGFETNPYQAAIFQRVKEGQTAVPVQERLTYTRMEYPDTVDVEVPQGVTGKLTTFLASFQAAMGQGLLEPASGDRITDCRRVAKTDDA